MLGEVIGSVNSLRAFFVQPIRKLPVLFESIFKASQYLKIAHAVDERVVFLCRLQ